MANRYGNLVGSKRISEDFETINVGFDRVQAEMDTKGTPADAQAKADAAKAAAIATAAEALAAHKARGADEHPNATGAAAGFMSSADKGRMNAATADPTASTLMQRDAEGRAKVTAPAAADDIARKAETDTVQANLDSHAMDTNIHVTEADHTKLNGIAAGAEVNQNAFAVINDVEASSKSDTVIFEGGTGITVTTDPEGKRIVLTATGEATPGAHASSHITGGTDVIPDAVVSGSSGLMSGSDAKFVRQDGESKTGAQAKADAAEQAANEYTDQKVGEIVIDDASLSQKGITKLSSATGSDSESEAATPKAVNTVRQLAVSQIGDLAELQTTDKDNLVDALNEVFTSGSEFKGDVADAITAKGVPTSASDSKATFVQNIESIETSTVINGQQQVTRTYAETIAANDPVLTKTTYTNDLNFAENLTAAAYLTLSPDGVYLAITIGTSPFITIFKRNGSTFSKLPDPAILPTGTAQALAFSSDGVYLAVPHNTSPFITIYKRTGDIFTKLPNPSVLPADFGQIALFSPDGTYLVVGNANTGPYLNIYKRSGDTFTRLPNPSILPSSGVLGLAFSSDGTYLYVGGSGSPYVIVYKRSGDTFTKINDSALALPSTGRAGAFSPDDAYLAIALTGSPTVYIYKRNGDSFTKLPDLGTLPLGNGVGISFSPTNGEHLIVAHSAPPYISVFKRSGDKFIQTDAFDVAPIGAPSSIAFDADGKTLAARGGVSPYARVYTVQKDRAYKSSNNLTDALSNNSIGYALESGNAGETKDIMTIWRS